ncbi:MAG: ferritin-like domain-containing protein [Planctomycetes bacterium]|nr:ferritin-like domain-containing protein [Planctomycetota bacterium]
MIQKKKPEGVSVGREGQMNRTGIGASPKHGKQMVEAAVADVAAPQDGKKATTMRRFYLEESDAVGTMPPPTSVKGAAKTVKEALTGNKATVLIDKVAERLAFERTGTRLYEAILTKHEVLGSFDGGPSAEDLEHIRDEELEHFIMLKKTLEELGADPTVMTPSADLAGVEGMGLGQVLGDPRTTLAQGLHALMIAEVADKVGWEHLIALAQDLGQTQLVERFRKADKQEQEHVQRVSRWLSAYTSATARMV